MIYFLSRELRKTKKNNNKKTNNGILISFKFSKYLFSTGTASTNKLYYGIPVTHF